MQRIILLQLSQPAITCSKLTIEKIEQGVRYVQSQHKRHEKRGVFIVNFEHISYLVLVCL